ncbi:FmdB family zinc ribbon protein [uncultured Arthrobacter sp.]|uniref:FmdB family zinc ribbon protein n=1 Tax=uncultured Arthrobacter sp. TaxID=114050 RepID=UPI00260EE460|nr:FmdB family zinc ribbon protein [uncultured Arthrobacter sp.]
MPMYAYACKDCGHAFDIQQSFSEDSLAVCPECSGALRKKFNSVGVVFKGSGFYRNDSRSGPVSAEAGSAPGTPATTASGGSAEGTRTPTSDSSSTTPTTAPAAP